MLSCYNHTPLFSQKRRRVLLLVCYSLYCYQCCKNILPIFHKNHNIFLFLPETGRTIKTNQLVVLILYHHPPFIHLYRILSFSLLATTVSCLISFLAKGWERKSLLLQSVKNLGNFHKIHNTNQPQKTQN